MKRMLLSAGLVLVAGSLFAAEPKEEVQNAAKALGEKDNYSWTAKNDITRDTESFQSEATGMSEKDGFTHLTMPFRQNSVEIVTKGDKGAVRTEEGWRSFAEIESNADNQNRGRFLARLMRSARGPAVEVADLVEKAKELKKSENSYTGELTEEGAKELLSFGRGGGGASAQVSDAKGTVTFEVEDGVLTGYSYEVEGTVTREGNRASVKRKTDVEIRDVGTTKVVVPDEARSKAS